jgi:AraC family transcriptional regulator
MPANNILKYYDRITKVLDYIDKNPAGSYHLEELADVACYSSFHFHKIFSAAVGESPASYIKRQKIKRSLSQLLHNPSMNITDIALSNGFSSSANFAKAFHQFLHLSPRQCRKMEYPLLVKKLVPNLSLPHNISFNAQQINTFISQMHYETCEDFTVVYLRYIGTYSWRLGLVWFKLINWARKQGLLQNKFKTIGIPYDNPDFFDNTKHIYDACITIDQALEPQNEFQVKVLKGGRYAVFPFEGHDHALHALYAAIYGKWLPDHKLEPDNRPDLHILRKKPIGRKLFLDLCIPIKVSLKLQYP